MFHHELDIPIDFGIAMGAMCIDVVHFSKKILLHNLFFYSILDRYSSVFHCWYMIDILLITRLRLVTIYCIFTRVFQYLTPIWYLQVSL
jgi:hypothetical protein